MPPYLEVAVVQQDVGRGLRRFMLIARYGVCTLYTVDVNIVVIYKSVTKDAFQLCGL